MDWAQPRTTQGARAAAAPAPTPTAPPKEEIAVRWVLVFRDGSAVEDVPLVVHIPTIPDLLEIGNRTAAWFGGVPWDSVDPEIRSLAHRVTTVSAMLPDVPQWFADAMEDDPVLLAEVYERLMVLRGLYWNGARQAMGTGPEPEAPVLAPVGAPLAKHTAESLREALAAAAAAETQTKMDPLGLSPVVYRRPAAAPASAPPNELPEEDALVGAREG